MDILLNVHGIPFVSLQEVFRATLYLSHATVANISESFTHKMAAKTSWHRYVTKLRQCHLWSVCLSVGHSREWC